MLKRLLQDGKKNIISDFYIVFDFYTEIFYKTYIKRTLKQSPTDEILPTACVLWVKSSLDGRVFLGKRGS